MSTSQRSAFASSADLQALSPGSRVTVPKIWVTTPVEGIDCGYRYGTVKKTVAYLPVDEDEYGEPVVEKWHIKQRRDYA